MAKNFDVELIIKARDYASKVVQKIVQNAEKATGTTTQQAEKGAKAQQQAVNQTAKVAEQANKRTQKALKETASQAQHSANQQRQAGEQAARAYAHTATRAEMAGKRIASAKKQLEIRTEREIRAEIRQTMQAYQLLARSGTASARDLARAYDKAKNKVRELNAEMGKTPTGQRLGNIGRGLMSVGAGVAAGAMVMAEPVKKSMGYDRDLAMVANTAFSDRDVAGRIAGKKELHSAIENAVKEGGGTKEEALSAIDTLLASGTVKADTAMALLPTLQKGAVATGASTEDLAKIAISSMQQFGIQEQDIGKVLDMAVAAGQAGNFELRDMAKWLPQQMAAAKQMGLNGIDGLQALLIANQQARVTAGTSDEAGNNLVNLLAKITSKETGERFEDLEYIDKKGRKRKINYLTSMEGYKAQGKNSLEAFMAIMDDVVGADENYKNLQERLKTAKGEEQKALLDQMTNLVEGTAIGKIISDRQALMALLGIRNNVQLGEEVKKDILNSEGSTETSHAVIRDTNDYKVDRLKASAEFAQMEGLKGFNDALGQTSEMLVKYMNQYPELSSTLAGLGTGVVALGTAAFAAAGALALLGGRNGGSLFDGFGRSRTTAARTRPLPSGSRGTGAGAWAGVGGRFFNVGGKLLSGLGVAEMAYVLGNEQPYQQARREIEEEKRSEGREKVAQSYGSASSSMGFAYGNAQMANAMGKTSAGVPLYGGYALAHLKQDDEVAKARLELGGYSEAAYQARLARNEQQRQGYLGVSQVSQDSTQAVRKLGDFAISIAEMATQQHTLQGQVDSVTTHFGQYHQEIQTLANNLPHAIEAGIAAQSHTMNNHIVLELDGRVVAENTSQYFFNMANRGNA